jgi:streptogramin lyase
MWTARAIVAWSLFVAARPAESQAREWSVVQELRIGSTGEGAAGFSDVRGLLVSDEGAIWILEYSTQDIRAFDASGKHLRTIGRRGPGEFLHADGMQLGPDAQVWVHDPRNGRFALFDQTGKFIRHQLAPVSSWGYVWIGGFDRSGRVWNYMAKESDPNRPFFRRTGADWSRSEDLTIPACGPSRLSRAGTVRLPTGTVLDVPFFAWPVAAYDVAAGVIWCAPSSNEHRWLKLSLESGDTLARFNAAASRLPVTSGERDSVVTVVRRILTSERVSESVIDWSRIPRYKPVIREAFVDDEGRLWVDRVTNEKATVLDVYSPSGEPVATLRTEHRIYTRLRPIVKGDTIWFLATDDDDVPYVVRGRIRNAS